MSYDTGSYVNSERSASSNTVEYATGALIKLQPPTDILLNPDGTATWRGVYGADYYSVFVYISSNGDKYANNSTQTFVSGKVDANGMFTCDVHSGTGYASGFQDANIELTFDAEQVVLPVVEE